MNNTLHVLYLVKFPASFHITIYIAPTKDITMSVFFFFTISFSPNGDHGPADKIHIKIKRHIKGSYWRHFMLVHSFSFKDFPPVIRISVESFVELQNI